MIRPVEQKDRQIFVSMIEQFYHSSAVLHPIPSTHGEGTFEELMKDSPYLKAYLFEVDGQPAGYGLLSLTYSNEAGGLAVWVEEVLILEEFRGQGLGSKFFAFLREEFSNAKRFRLEVTRSNHRAAKLYAALGYEELDYLQMVLDPKEA